MKVGAHVMRRFLTHKPPGNPKVIAPGHPAAVGAHTVYPHTLRAPKGEFVLKTGQNSRKIGALGNKWMFSVFSERCNLVRGTVDPNASRPPSYGWLTIRHRPFTPEFIVARRHVPPCRDRLERPGDYREAA